MSLDADLAKLSGAIYQPEWPEVERALPDGWYLYAPFDDGAAEAMICRKGAEASAIVFRGTEASRREWRDILANVAPMTAWDGPGSVHAGYGGYVKRLGGAIRATAQSIAGAPLYIAGHSLGGAVGSIYAAWVFYTVGNGHAIDGLVTFGSPKCMTRDVAEVIRCPVRRYAIDGDFAPYWPPKPRVVAPGERIRLKPPHPERGMIGRHSIDEYIAAVSKM